MSGAPPDGRHCGDCTLCCKIMAIEARAKPAGVWCPDCRPGRGCAIYADRPAECRDFRCLWLSDGRLDDRWKPSRSKLVLTTSEDGIEVRCDPGFPDAWRKAPFDGVIRGWAATGAGIDVTVLVLVGRKTILVASDRDFDLGVVAPDEQILREFEGGRLVDVRVGKAPGGDRGAARPPP